jgi:hypothetical protein
MTGFRFPGRIPAVAVMATGAFVLAGCGSLQETRECLQYEQVPYQHQVCETRSSTGFCTHMRSETRYREVCKRYGESKAKSTAGRSSGDRIAALEEEARKRNATLQSDFDQQVRLVAANYPPRSFESCRKLDGVWYAKCERIEDGACTQASRTEGMCTDHFTPRATSREACASQGGFYVPACASWGTVRKGREAQVSCVTQAPYGMCREDVAAAAQLPSHVQTMDHSSFTMVNPRALKPGKSTAALAAELRLLRPHYPPKSFESCQNLNGTWYAACTRKVNNKCVEASRTNGVCDGALEPWLANAACAMHGISGRSAHDMQPPERG